jgi:hypothetical protein
MDQLDDVRYGWEFMEKVLGADFAGLQAQNDFTNNILQNNQIKLENNRIETINSEIDKLITSLNELKNHNLREEQLKGFVAEEWHAGTFNIDAVRKMSEHRAWTLKENGYGSVDIDTNFGKQYSLKYSNTAKDAEQMQALLDKDTRVRKYHGQESLIAEEQLDDAKAIARRREIRNVLTRTDVAEAHKETREHLTGKVSDDNGVESKSLSIKESKQIAKEINKDGFNAEKHGFTKEQLMEEVRINYMNQAMKAGLTAASITAMTQLVPELYKAIDYLIKNGEIDLNSVKQSSGKIITASGESFLRGSIAYTVEMGIQNGLFGEAIQTISPSIVGSMVAIILGTIKNSILVAAGKMTANQMGGYLVDSIIISSGYIASMELGGMIVQALCPELPMVGYAIGSLLGCSLSIAYGIGKKHLISFCVDSGFTCFGLVDQNYELPEETLSRLGVEYIPISKAKISTTNINKISTGEQIEQNQLETIDIQILKRGIIGINKIGYVL